MTGTQRENLRKKLLDEEKNLRTSLSGHSEESRAEGDPLDNAKSNRDRDVDFAMVNGNALKLAEVIAALGNIDSPNYGICDECEETIAPRRLVAVPWTRYCIKCQDEMGGEQRFRVA